MATAQIEVPHLPTSRDEPLLTAWRDLLAVGAALEALPISDPAIELLDQSQALRGFIAEYPASTIEGLEIKLRMAVAEVEETREASSAMLRGDPPASMEYGTSLIWSAVLATQRVRASLAAGA